MISAEEGNAGSGSAGSALTARRAYLAEVLRQCDIVLRVLERESSRLSRMVPPDQEAIEHVIRRINAVAEIARRAAAELEGLDDPQR